MFVGLGQGPRSNSDERCSFCGGRESRKKRARGALRRSIPSAVLSRITGDKRLASRFKTALAVAGTPGRAGGWGGGGRFRNSSRSYGSLRNSGEFFKFPEEFSPHPPPTPALQNRTRAFGMGRPPRCNFGPLIRIRGYRWANDSRSISVPRRTPGTVSSARGDRSDFAD